MTQALSHQRRLAVIPASILLAFIASAGTAAAVETFDSGDIAPGDTFAFTFHEVYPEGHTYHCHPHPDMVGMVHVEQDTDGTTRIHHVDIVDSDDPSTWGYSIEHLAIEAGDTVVWTNQGSHVHTVTAGGEGHEGMHGDGHAGAHATDGGDGASGDDHAGHGHSDADAPGPGLAGAVLALALAGTILRRGRQHA